MKTYKLPKMIAHLDLQGNTHDLAEHLQKSAILAAHFASLFGADEWAYAAALWHDIGKYSDAFQAKLAPDAHIEERQGRVNHSSAGALYAVKQLGEYGKLLAYLIAGHHAGLPDFDSAEEGAASLHVRLQNDTSLLDDALKNADKSVINLSKKPTQKPLGGSEGLHLWLRMLYSCLVDADFLDTEAFMDSKRTEIRGSTVSLDAMTEVFKQHMQGFADKSGTLNEIRSAILTRCESAAQIDKRLFSLSVPTGGGKTLSSLAFALNHTRTFNKSRIIYAIPYTSIIEQTGAVFADIFRSLEGSVLEHHSNLDPLKETPKSRLASENWDAPLIVTTTVQLFESLFAAKSSHCRKLHNIVNSVIILDEAQLLPPELLKPILQSIRLLSAHYGVTFLLCTATQPELRSRHDALGSNKLLEGLDKVHEIIEHPETLYRELKRVDVTIDDPKAPKKWETIAQEISAHSKVLAIVNTRADAATLFRLMPQDTIHLSALMCPQHRSDTIAHIKARLQDDQPIRVVSTQLVEAGVDIDFPVVYRALAGLDSIAQAAGRCNREGKLPSLGAVRVFIPPKPAPSGLLRFGEQAMKNMMVNPPKEWLDPSNFARYFDLYYEQIHSFDKQEIIKNMLTPSSRLALQFRSAAKAFKMIDDNGSQGIVVRYDQKAESLLEQLRHAGASRDLMRRLGRYSVSLPRYHFEALQKRGDLEEIEGVFVLKPSLYHPSLGVVVADAAIAPESLWV